MREVSVSAIIPATLMARKAFYALGRKTVYTNSYKDCHTVCIFFQGLLKLILFLKISQRALLTFMFSKTNW